MSSGAVRYCGAGPWPDLLVRGDAVRLVASLASEDWGLSVKAEVWRGGGAANSRKPL